MGRRFLAYLHQNRHGTFTFRWRPPLDLADRFAQSAFAFSLRTKLRNVAWQRALPATMRVQRLVPILRAMSSPKTPKKPFLTTELVRYLVMPDGKEHKVDYNLGDPVEVAEANRIFNELAQAVQGATDPLTGTDQYAAPSPSPAQAPAGRGGPTISVAFAEFCTEKTQSLAWKDPEHAKRYDFGPIIEELIGVAGDRPPGRGPPAHAQGSGNGQFACLAHPA